jgi:acetyltransferase-like isoleucine patch superfamily enzyme
MRTNATIRIGEDCGLSGTTICSANRIEIGRECLLGANVTIIDTDFHPRSPAGRRYNKDINMVSSGEVIIEDEVFLGMGVIVLKNSTIGTGSVVGAGAVISGPVPPRSIVAGNPGRVVGVI